MTIRRAILIPAALSIIAGVTDVTSWLLLGGFFSAHVTGNLVVIAADVVTGERPDTAGLLAIPIFIVVTVIAAELARRIGVAAARTNTLLGLQAAFLVAAAGASFFTRASADPKEPMAVFIGLLAVCAMASQNAYLHLVPPKAPSTAVMTGNLVTATIAGVDLIRSRGRDIVARERWAGSWPLLAGFTLGCLLGAVAATTLGDQAAAVPAVLAVALLVVAARTRAVTPAQKRCDDGTE